MMNQEKKWAFIVNPIAGDGFAAKLVPELKNQTRKHQVQAEFVFTEKKGHATELAASYSREGFKYIIGVGGDGTFNEIGRSLVGAKDVITGLVPAGTGNDFIQILGFPDRFEDKDWDIFFSRSHTSMDVGSCNGMHFFNGMGLGFDAQVAAENYSEPGVVKKGGKNKYLWHIIKTILFYKEKRVISYSNDERHERDCFINTISIGRRFAGGFFLTPRAVADDGLLDVCMINKLNLFQRFNMLPKVPKGTHIEDPKVSYYTTDRISLEFTEEVPFHLDGELNFASKFEVSILHKSLSIIYNPKGDHFFGL